MFWIAGIGIGGADGGRLSAPGGSMPGGDVAKRFMATFVLWLLLERRMHGYAIIKTMQKDGMPKATASRMYPLLEGMERDGLVRSASAVLRGRKVSVYSTTARGMKLLARAKSHFFTGLKREFFQFMLE